MKWRYAVLVLVVLSTVAVRVAVGVPRTQEPSLTLTGQVDIALGPDGKLMVLVDEASATQPNDGLVDHVFRLQGADALAYSGQATVTSVRGRLTVEFASGSGWVFTVAGRTLPPPDPGLTAYTVGGIAHQWGESVHQPPATLFSTLSAGTCSQAAGSSLSFGVATLDGDPACKNCASGGAGSTNCAITCDGGSSCETDCGSDSFACCSCPGACTCCSLREVGGGGHH